MHGFRNGKGRVRSSWRDDNEPTVLTRRLVGSGSSPLFVHLGQVGHTFSHRSDGPHTGQNVKTKTLLWALLWILSVFLLPRPWRLANFHLITTLTNSAWVSKIGMFKKKGKRNLKIRRFGMFCWEQSKITHVSQHPSTLYPNTVKTTKRRNR